jgi:hypothetical protein
MKRIKAEGQNARRGADILLEILASEGVEYIFGNPGTTELPLMDALLGAPAIKYVLALQEASAVAMADGYAQAARRPGERVTDPPRRNRWPAGFPAHRYRSPFVRRSRPNCRTGREMGKRGHDCGPASNPGTPRFS